MLGKQEWASGVYLASELMRIVLLACELPPAKSKNWLALHSTCSNFRSAVVAWGGGKTWAWIQTVLAMFSFPLQALLHANPWGLLSPQEQHFVKIGGLRCEEGRPGNSSNLLENLV